jgi:hypothetical protein
VRGRARVRCGGRGVCLAIAGRPIAWVNNKMLRTPGKQWLVLLWRKTALGVNVWLELKHTWAEVGCSAEIQSGCPKGCKMMLY